MLNLNTLINQGGVMIIPLCFFSVLALAIILERSFFWIKQSKKIDRRQVEDFFNEIKKGNESKAHSELHLSTDVALTVIDKLWKEHASCSVSEKKKWLLVYAERELNQVEKYHSFLSTVITVSPLMGILGTVLGIIKAFHEMAKGLQISSTQFLSSGISEALITTAVGLSIAILTLIFMNIFLSLGHKQKNYLEDQLSKFEIILENKSEKY